MKVVFSKLLKVPVVQKLIFLCLFTIIDAGFLIVLRNVFTSTLLFDQILATTLITICFFVAISILANLFRRTLLSFATIFTTGFIAANLLMYPLMNIDRSRSFYVLNWVDKGQIYFEGDTFVTRVISNESKDTDAIKQRIFEHNSRKLLEISADGEIELTRMGKIVLYFSHKAAAVFSLTGWAKNSN